MNEDELRRNIAQLQELVRGSHIASAGKNPQVEFPPAGRVEAPARAADLASGRGTQAAPDGRRPAPPLRGRGSEIKGFGPPGHDRQTASADILAERAETALSPGADPSDAMRDHRNYEDELEDFLPEHEEQFSTSAAAANVISPRYLLGASAIVIVLGLGALAASFAFDRSTYSVGETAQNLEPKTSELEQEETQAQAMPRDMPAGDPQLSSALRDKVEDASEASPPSESRPVASEANRPPTASPQQVQDPLAAAAQLAQPMASFNAPALPTGAFLSQEPPQAPAAGSTKETPGRSGKIAHARGETPVESLAGSPQSPPKRASQPRRRLVSAPSERPRAKAAQGERDGAPPQETPRDTAGAEAHRPSEYILQRALDALNGSE